MGEAIPDDIALEQLVTTQELEELSDLYEEVCKARHAMGAQKYGPIDFMNNNIAKMLLEELVDIGNYSRYLFIKVSIMVKLLDIMKDQEQSTSGFFNPARPAEEE
jgi:hypothetical protein